MTPTRIRVDLGERSYDVLIGPGLIDSAGSHIAGALPARRVAIVTDANVAGLHLSRFERALDAAGIESVAVKVAPGEGSKSFRTLETVTDALIDARLERGDAVIALGGGVVGDLAGFAAAITRRGMAYVQVPTSLLAQVDSSVGGKTGINTRHGKNLVGAFQQPTLVLADTSVLDTLPRREFAAGYAEVAKYGLLGDASFFDWLEANRPAIFDGGPLRAEAIARCCRAKARIVAADERETGERALLNLGHTFGHALEASAGFNPDRLIHGEAVAIGMVLAHDFSVAQGYAPKADADRARAHLATAGLPVGMDAIPGGGLDVDELMRHIGQDKKVKRGSLTFILTRGVGRAFIADDVPADAVREFLSDQLAA